jgi:hypothetical protein
MNYARDYRVRYTKIDSTGIGQPLAERLLKKPGPNELSGEGVNFSGNHKAQLLGEGQRAIQSRAVTFPYQRELVNSLVFYQEQDKGLFTDPVFAFCLAVSAGNRVTGRTTMLNTQIPMIRNTYMTKQGLYLPQDDDDDDFMWTRLERI